MTGSYNTMVGNNEGSMVSAMMAQVTIHSLKGHILVWIQSRCHTGISALVSLKKKIWVQPQFAGLFCSISVMTVLYLDINLTHFNYRYSA